MFFSTINKNVKLNQIREGSTVYVRGDFGGGLSVKAIVTCVDSDIKNGLPGIDYTTEDGDNRWAYLTQVDRVINF